jgi:hypothetical protein
MGCLNEKLLVTVQKLLERDLGETFWLLTQELSEEELSPTFCNIKRSQSSQVHR